MIIMVLGILALLSLVILMILDTSVMESLLSQNSLTSEQAFQMAEGGTYLAAEQIYELLDTSYRTAETLPAAPVLTQTSFDVPGGSRPLQIKLRTPRLITQTSDHCIYEVISFGSCAPAKHGLKVWVRYDYLQFYAVSYDDDGSVTGMSFSHRQYLNRGEMVMMERITE